MPIFTAAAPAAAPARVPAVAFEGGKLRHAYDKLAFGVKVRSEFYTSMADFAESGIAPYQAISDMLVVAERRFSKKSRAKVLRSVLAVVEEGHGLPLALMPWVPPSEAVMLRGAESAGPETLIQTFRELGTLLARQAEAKAKLRKALGINLGMLAVMVGVMLQVISTLVPLVKSVPAGAAAKMPFAMGYFGLSQWFISNGILLLIAFVVIGAGIAVSLPTWTQDWRRPLDQYVPPYSIYQKLQATLFLSSTASMMRAGVTLNTVLADMGEFGSRWMRHHVRRMKAVLDSGAGEVEAIAVGPMPNDAADALQIYQRIPRFQDVMSRLAEANFRSYEASIASISAVLSLFSMFLMTAFGASTVIAMFQFSDAMQASAQAAQNALGG